MGVCEAKEEGEIEKLDPLESARGVTGQAREGRWRGDGEDGLRVGTGACAGDRSGCSQRPGRRLPLPAVPGSPTA